MDGNELTPEILLRAYAMGVFPMAETRDDPEVFWVEPRRRGILPLNGFHISHSLARHMRGEPFAITLDRDFEGVLDGCADRPETWISETIRRLYCDLFDLGYGHSLEVWEGETLVGGVYGVALGAAFFGESMFSRRTDASKIALAYLTHLLSEWGFELFDTQFITPHLRSLGGMEISRSHYQALLQAALARPARFEAGAVIPPAYEVLQRSTQTS